MAEADEIHDFQAARKKWANKVDNGKAARKSREKKLATVADGRSMRATGRTEIMSIRCSEDTKSLCKKLAEARGMSMAEWLESIAEEQAKAEGISA